jgi:ABC-type Fe3+-siderophore transport system permease subunit
MNPTPSRFQWRAFTSVLIAVSFVVLAVTGAMLFVSPPGRVANWTHWTLLGLAKHQWTGLHVGFSALFLVITSFHLVFNWRPLLGYFKDRWTRRLGLRWEWAAALAACGLACAGIQANLPPFSTLLGFSESVKQSWERPAERAS